jgi:DNA-binding winged helix-turn-helix (wHTH) protein
MDYRFGPWHIAVGAREFRRDGELQAIARRVFECLAYLIEHRQRAVGRDELVAALWGRVDVADVLVSQLIARARKAIGDDAQGQRAIRTIPGFGYRWVMPLDEAEQPGPPPQHVPPTAAPPISSSPHFPLPQRRRRLLGAVMLGVALVTAAVAVWRVRPVVAPAPATRAAVVVLPFEVSAAQDMGWLRLGAMDLIGERLRGAGLAVPSSDSVLVALHASGSAAATDAAAAMLGARLLVRGRIARAPEGWRVELDARGADGAQHIVTALRPLPTDAARQAGDLLLAALGHAEAPAGAQAAENDALEERLQRAQAAILANEFDAARTILEQADPADHGDPRLRYRLAQIDFHAGRLAESDAALRELLADPALLPGGLEANALVARGMLAMRRDDCAGAQAFYAAGADRLERGGSALEQGNALAGRGMARSCLGQFDAAANDLGLARTRMTSAGDRLGLARVDNYLGLLDAGRHRLADALVDFREAAATFERFGAVDALRAALTGQLEMQAALLQHTEALATSERLWALRARIADPGQRLALAADRAGALLGAGHLQAAAEVLAGAEADLALPAQAGDARYLHGERARLAALNGDAALAAAEAERALAGWPARVDEARRGRVALLLQRARPDAPSVAGDGPAASPLDGVLRAEAAARRRDDAGAERRFAQALAAAEADGVPATTAAVAIAYADWLLARGRAAAAAEVGARVARWADRDFDCALLQARLHRALGRDDLRAASLRQAQTLAGERRVASGLSEAVAADSALGIR